MVGNCHAVQQPRSWLAAITTVAFKVWTPGKRIDTRIAYGEHSCQRLMYRFDIGVRAYLPANTLLIGDDANQPPCLIDGPDALGDVWQNFDLFRLGDVLAINLLDQRSVTVEKDGSIPRCRHLLRLCFLL